MLAETQFVGIDVSKERLDVHLHPAGEAFSVANSPAGLKDLKRRLRKLKLAAIGLEASGGYEKPAADDLAAAGLRVHVLEPSQVRALARALKRRAKTDAIDAAMIARYLAIAGDELIPHQPDLARERIRDLEQYRRMLQEEDKALKSLLDTTREPTVRSFIARRRAVIVSEIRKLAAEIKAQIAADPALARLAAKLRSVDGVGPVLATTLIAHLKETGHTGSKKLASLVGLAPHPRQSGKTALSGKCGGGRKQVRDVAYMATLSAIKARMPHLYPFYKRLREAGKPFKVALIATTRKFLTILNAIVRDDSEFRRVAP
jgi:transposase